MIQRTTITCCKECRDRYPGCHDKCNTYQEQKRERQALLDQEHSIPSSHIVEPLPWDKILSSDKGG